MPSSAQSVPLVRVYDYLIIPGNSVSGNAPSRAGRTVTLRLSPAQSSSGPIIATSIAPVTQLPNVPLESTVTDGNGYWEIWVVPTDNINPSGMQYIVDDGYRTYKINPVAAGIPGIGWQSSAIITSAPAVLNPAGQTVASLAVSSLTAGEVVFAGAAGLLSDDSNLVWDNTNKRLGIGMAPVDPLSVAGFVGVNDASGTASAQTRFYENAVLKGLIASIGANGVLVNDGVAGDILIRTQGGGFRVTTNSGASSALAISAAGLATFTNGLTSIGAINTMAQLVINTSIYDAGVAQAIDLSVTTRTGLRNAFVQNDVGAGVAAMLGLTNAVGIGNGAQTAVTSPAHGTGTGPANAQVVTDFLKVYDGVNVRWIPVMT